MTDTERKPSWIRYKIPCGESFIRVKSTVSELGLHTICTEARCPNSGECFSRGTATFLILGDTCTRNCRYCAVTKGVPAPPDLSEPARIAEAVKKLNLKYAVITSVTRDDIPDGGAAIFADTCRLINSGKPDCLVELLVPDFRYNIEESLKIILKEKVHILNHNIETVREKFRELRPSGDYEHSLRLMRIAADMGAMVKSGLMIGFGETISQIKSSMEELVSSGCSILTVGQYLQPSKNFHEVVKYYHPDEFEEIKKTGLDLGLKRVIAGPNVRSSYLAETIF